MREEQFSVWTYHDDPSWNCGIPDMVIVGNLTLASAHMAQQRLRMVAPKQTWEIRNESGQVVITQEVVADPATNPEIRIAATHERREPLPARGLAKPRRKLGGGAQA